jgi:hypothetical protein
MRASRSPAQVMSIIHLHELSSVTVTNDEGGDSVDLPRVVSDNQETTDHKKSLFISGSDMGKRICFLAKEMAG